MKRMDQPDPFYVANPTFCRAIRQWGHSTEIQDRIIQMIHPRRRYGAYKGNRPKKPLGFYRTNALRILCEITGLDFGFELLNTPTRLDIRIEWLLETLYDLVENHPLAYEQIYFLKAIAKDAGVWPAPKWWRVRRRLQPGRSFSTRRF